MVGRAADVSAETTRHRQQVKDDYSAQSGKLTEVTRHKTDLEGKLQTDFGPDSAFLPLVDR